MTDRSDKRFAAAIAAHRVGNHADAEAGFRRVLATTPRHAGALYMLGTAELRRGRTLEAAELLRRSIGAEPRFAPAHSNLGAALLANDRHDEAAASFEAALAIDGTAASAHLGLSAAMLAIGKTEASLAAAMRAAQLQPRFAAAHGNAGRALARLGRTAEAEAAYRAALGHDAAHAESLRGLAELRRDAGRDPTETAELLRRAARTERGPGGLVELAELHRGRGDAEAAAAALREARARDADDPLLRLAETMAPLASLHADAASRLRAIADYDASLSALDDWVRAGGTSRLASFADVLGRVQPFFLPYATDDVLDLQRRYGRLAADATTARYGRALKPPALPDDGERIRLGIVTGFVREHSVWKVPLAGWLRALDRARFDVTLYHLDDATDAVTAEARGLVERCHAGSRSTAAWRERILADRPHALVYPEIGMHGGTVRLAAMRLAGLQCAGPGQPVTTGLPTIDLFLSSELMEPENGAAQYDERLVALPGLGFPWRPPRSATTAAELPPLPGGTRFFCGQSPFKYRPDDDDLLVAIARRVPEARFVLVAGAGEAGLGDRLAGRLRDAFAVAGLDWSAHGHVVGRVSPSVFATLADACDVVLDNPSWSGCNSTLEGLVGGTPVVTLPGPTMRSRHTAAILRKVGVTDGVALDRADYVEKAVSLGVDPVRRAAVRDRLHAVDAAMLDDASSVRALEAVLQAQIEKVAEDAKARGSAP